MARRSSATRHQPSAVLKGRHWLVAWLGLFLASALVVVWRQSASLATSRDLQQLEKTRGQLEVTKATLQAQILRDRSRAVLVPIAQQRLGMRLPQDSEITILHDTRPR
jgi:hypothetical protein